MGAVHASCVVLGEDGILIRGPSGSGKSTLVRDLLRLGAISGLFAALVGDDRVTLTQRHGRLVAAPHPALAGLLEIRGLGLQPVDATVSSAILRLVVDLAEAVPRMPEAGTGTILLQGVALPRMVLSPDPGRATTVLWRWRRLRVMMMTD
ncbi:HPr kinase/phosphorylase [Methylobacterium frigidaeris]|uniref:HPr kinase/phosphorylase n=1 Tax=Methylobacterium frigidaeris TaxID=2038277 RepID=A0AA37HDN3_9HYPH|nr:HPr kinase/phosphatase C-terminal domain-containing protein [Methylobacterium frigidaeris]PIK70988.1 serine kinase [Methylobacterium frigidaeris]GJD63902.1 HPr kinase/phosphorylase [Methylobacterium frigidaeris]